MAPFKHELDEKDFVQKEPTLGGLPPWAWMMIILTFLGILWGLAQQWSFSKSNSIVQTSQLHQVTNREMSLYLWENPGHMKGVVKGKVGYLDGFEKINPVPSAADDLVKAPPELLFRYHLWNRLLGSYSFPVAISKRDFQEFLLETSIWLPKFWSKAPNDYVVMIEKFEDVSPEDFQKLTEKELPPEVRRAFIGWKNYHKQLEEIETRAYTAGEVRALINKYPGFERHNWRNIFPNYLSSIDAKTEDNAVIPREEMPTFLILALYQMSGES